MTTSMLNVIKKKGHVVGVAALLIGASCFGVDLPWKCTSSSHPANVVSVETASCESGLDGLRDTRGVPLSTVDFFASYWRYGLQIDGLSLEFQNGTFIILR